MFNMYLFVHAAGSNLNYDIVQHDKGSNLNYSPNYIREPSRSNNSCECNKMQISFYFEAILSTCPVARPHYLHNINM